jgi:hypothetical protein
MEFGTHWECEGPSDGVCAYSVIVKDGVFVRHDEFIQASDRMGGSG